ncbi:MAG: hypothetical protein ORO03_01995, partial [Alphaproteobacteria bacterium]|nr:hypothetical protein [Alphaproteobacteria bacterium]
FGVIFGGPVEIKNLTRAGAASNLNYIQAAGIQVTGPSHFNRPLTLHSTGSVTSSAVPSLKDAKGSIVISSDLSVGTAGDGVSDLSLWNNADNSSFGILVINATLRVGGSVEALSNRSSLTGFTLKKSTFVGGGDLKLFSFRGNEVSGISIVESTVTVARDLIIKDLNSGAVLGVWMESSKITLGRDMMVNRTGLGLFATAIGSSNLNLTAGRDVILEQSDYATNPIRFESCQFSAGRDFTAKVKGSGYYNSFDSYKSSIVAGRDLTVEVSGETYSTSIQLGDTVARAGHNLILTQTATAEARNSGIIIGNSSLSAGADLSLLQLGVVEQNYNSTYPAIAFDAKFNGVVGAVKLSGGHKDLSWITIRSNGSIGLGLYGSDNFNLTHARVRIDLKGMLGTGSHLVKAATLNAQGLDVFYNSAASGNSVNFDLGSGIFVRIIDRRSTTT